MIRYFPIKQSILKICPLIWFLTCSYCCCCYDDDVFELFVIIITEVAAAEVVQNWGQTHFSYVQGYYLGTMVAQWLRCCATNREVTGSIPAGVIRIFH